MQTTTDVSTLDERLRDYARLLQANGFTVYLRKWKPWNSLGGTKTTHDYFSYSQIVNGVERFGSCEILGPQLSHYMPVDNSGRRICVDGVPNEMTVHAARDVAQAVNRGKYEWEGGIHVNHSILDTLYGDDYVVLASGKR